MNSDGSWRREVVRVVGRRVLGKFEWGLGFRV